MTARPTPTEVVTRWWPEALLVVTVILAGLTDATYGLQYWAPSSAGLATSVVMAIAVALFRRVPEGALAATWLAGLLFVLLPGSGIPTPLLGAAAVAYGCARHGSRGVVWASGLSIPAAGLAGVLVVLVQQAGRSGILMPRSLIDSIYDLVYAAPFPLEKPFVVVLVAIAGFTVLVVPWLTGLALRARAGQAVAEQARDEAESETRAVAEIAGLRAEQAQLARDVHDVVGHSLAVILAQAESAQFLPDDRLPEIRQTLTHVATAARQSLRDVRGVLASTRDGVPPPPPGSWESLVDGVRATGQQVDLTQDGTPRPLPPELEVVAFRVLQEMLTNALKHGVREDAIVVDVHWADDLRIEVANATTQPVPGVDGQGLDGMRRRLDGVGGRLDVRRRAHPDGGDGRLLHTATAWVPVRAREIRR